jgi:predicted DNA-binding transcriptional regulator AlpA
MSNTGTTEKLLRAVDVGRILNLSKRQIFRLNSSGKIPAPIRIGGAVRWAESTIAEWLAAGAPDRKTLEAMQQTRIQNDE